MVSRQYLRRHALCRILVNDKEGAMRDVTNDLDPFLISVTIVDSYGSGVDKCSIELDDRDGRLDVPNDKTRIQVWLGWADAGPRITPVSALLGTLGTEDELPFGGGDVVMTFDGVLAGIECGFSRRSGGRRMWIEATGGGLGGEGKSPGMSAMGDGVSNIPFSDFFGNLAKAAGYPNIQLGENIGKVTRPFWFIGRSESFHNFADRIAQEIGAEVKFSGGDTVTMVGKTDPLYITGKEYQKIEATWGVNLISYRLKPFVARPQYGQSKSQWFNVWQGVWQEATHSIEGAGMMASSNASTQLPNPAPNRQLGEQFNRGAASTSRVERGLGWVIINGEPAAKAGNYIIISGARAGLDGSWRIKEAEHTYSRKSGYTTRCDLDNPSLNLDPGVGGRFDNEPRAGDPEQKT